VRRRITAIAIVVFTCLLSVSLLVAGLVLSHSKPVNHYSLVTEISRSRPQQPASYVIQPGDTLSIIADRYMDGNWEGLYEANREIISNPDVIYAGQRIILAIRQGYQQPAATPVSYQRRNASYAVNSNFQACVIQRESGGNPDIWNPTGHWGLYQFSLGTWEAYGGAGYLFGHASAAYQTQIFNNAIRAGGEGNWSAYDGC
jgi:Transglycosylase-like domain/LysM domain